MKVPRVIAFAATIGLLAVGCGGETTPPPKVDSVAFKGTTDDDKSKVAEILKKENIEGEIVGLISGEKVWQVDVGVKGTPGKRATPRPPSTYSIDKATGKVTKQM